MINKIKKTILLKIYRSRITFLFFILKVFFGINIIYNKNKKLNSKEIIKYFNVLYVTESPIYAIKNYWFQNDYLYDLEVSFRSKTKADNLLVLKDTYALVDVFGRQLYKPKAWKLKKSKCVALFSNKNSLRGHKLRHEIYKKRSIFEISFDFYGSIINRSFDSSVAIYNEYKYAIVVENELSRNYVSEKFFDAIKGKVFIFYFGDKESIVDLGFNTKSIIFFNSASDLITKINNFFSSNSIDPIELQEALNTNYEILINMRRKKVNNFIENLSTILHINNSYLKGVKNDWKK